MPKPEPMLRVNFSKLGKPICSACGEEFDTDVSAIDLLASFTFHVRHEHVQKDASQTAARIVREATDNK